MEGIKNSFIHEQHVCQRKKTPKVYKKLLNLVSLARWLVTRLSSKIESVSIHVLANDHIKPEILKNIYNSTKIHEIH